MYNFLFASGNQHKALEVEAVFKACGLNCAVQTPSELGFEFSPVEDGAGFLDNALIKARAIFALKKEHGLTAFAVLADDSGLCVDALNGRPGIYSARYGEKNGALLSSHEKNAMLLNELKDAASRKARFVCAAVLFFDESRFFTAQESVEGEIAKAESGAGGFGFDPVFLLPEYKKTFSELSESEKNKISHRGKAFSALAKLI